MFETVLRACLTVVLLGLGAASLRGWRRLRAAGHGAAAPGWRLAAYVAGLAALAGALLTPLDDLAAELFSAHMAQHLLLTMTAAPLLLLGNPLPIVLWGLPRRARRALGRPLTRGHRLRAVLAALTALPVAWLGHVATIWIWHLPSLYGAALAHEPVHALEHAMFFGTAILFWWPIIEPAPRVRRHAARGFKIVYLVAATAQNIFLGMFLSLPERVLYPHYLETAAEHGVDALADQALAGGLMWGGSHMYLLPILLILYTFARESHSKGGSRPPSEPPPATDVPAEPSREAVVMRPRSSGIVRD